MTRKISARDWEAISAYLDNELRPAERRRFESRLQQDRELRAALESLNQTRALLQQLPTPRAPRNFTLGPEMVPTPRSFLRLVPTLRFASVVATLLLVLVVAGDAFGLLGSQPAVVSFREPVPQAVSGTPPGPTAEVFLEAEPLQAPSDQLQTAEEPAADAQEPVPEEEAASGAPESEAPAAAMAGETLTPDVPGEMAERTLEAAELEAEESVPAPESQDEETPLTPEATAQPPTPTPTPVSDDEPGTTDDLLLRLLEVFLAGVAVISGLAAFLLRRRS